MAGFNNNQQQEFSSPKGLHQSSSSNSVKASGLATSKTVIYKRRRASRRVPTTILETSCQEFRDAVQKLTGFHRPTSTTTTTTTSSKQMAPMSMPGNSFEVDNDEHLQQQHHDYEDDQVAAAAQGGHQSSSSPQSSVLSDCELPHGEFFHHFLRESARKHHNNEVPNTFAAFANMPAHLRAAYRQPPSRGRSAMPPFWGEDHAFGSADFMGSLAKLQDPSMAPNPYLIALENQLLAKFARRMQFAASNPLDNPWYQMDHMAPLRA